MDFRSGLLRQAWVVLADAFGHFTADDGWAMASHVALSALMALFPFFIFVAAFAGTFGDPNLANNVAEMVFSAWPPEVAGPIAGQVRQVLAPIHGSLLTVSAVLALYFASNGIEAVRTALNRAYRVIDRRSVFILRAQSIFLVLVGSAGVVLLAAIGFLAAASPAFRPFEGLFATLGAAVTSVLVVVALVIAHVWLPAGRPHWTRLWPGIVGTLIAWLVSAWIFSYYLASFANYAATYAGLAGVVTVIFFLYIVAVLMIFGAEFNSALGRLRDRRIS
jgi:membrane protein